MKTDAVLVAHILDAIRQIDECTQGVSESEFFRNREKQDAVVRQLEIIGEASRKLSEAFTTQHSGIPWRAIVGMRHRMVHDYLNVDLSVVWETVQKDLPALRKRLQHITGA